MGIKQFILFCMFISMSEIVAHAQDFYKDILTFRKLDSISAPPASPILFIGSSSFTKWKELPSDFPEYKILNRAFGGSSLPHLIQYAEDIIFKYKPSQIFIYCGENDLAAGKGANADTVTQRFLRLMKVIRARLPKVPVVFLSLKPSPSREHLLPEMRKANQDIGQKIQQMKRVKYLDVHTPMLLSNGNVRQDIFLSDKLHMNRTGYEIWIPLIRPMLKK